VKDFNNRSTLAVPSGLSDFNGKKLTQSRQTAKNGLIKTFAPLPLAHVLSPAAEVGRWRA
jgi:hypothetical protein